MVRPYSLPRRLELPAMRVNCRLRAVDEGLPEQTRLDAGLLRHRRTHLVALSYCVCCTHAVHLVSIGAIPAYKNAQSVEGPVRQFERETNHADLIYRVSAS